MTYDSGYTRIGFPRPTPAIARLMIVNVVVFIVNMIFVGRLSERTSDGGGLWFALSWSGLWEGYGAGVLRLFTYQFTHSFSDPFHLLWNIVYMYFFGGLAERGGLGYRGTLLLYVAGGVFAGLFHMALYGVMTGGSVPVVGASGCCYALVLYAVCVAPRMEIHVVFFNFQLIFLGIVLVFVGLYVTYVELVRGVGGGVSHGAHLGGAVFGVLVWKLGWFRYAWSGPEHGVVAALKARWRGWRRAREAADQAAHSAELDRILEKVGKSGLQSLTAAERRFLDRRSQDSRRK